LAILPFGSAIDLSHFSWGHLLHIKADCRFVDVSCAVKDRATDCPTVHPRETIMPKTALLIPLMAFFLSIPLHAAVLLDQQNVVTVGPDLSLSDLGVDVVYSTGQVFTVGITGQLTRIDLQVWREFNSTLPLFVDLATTLNGTPRDIGTGVLATRSVSASSLSLNPAPADPSFVSFDFSSANIQVHAGDRLAIILRNSDPDDTLHGYGWASTDQGSNTYPGGNAWTFGRPPHADGIFHETSTFPQAVQDQGFRTFIAVPLPNSLAAVLPLLILIAFLKRREYKKGNFRA
jgi:hypothetical protein